MLVKAIRAVQLLGRNLPSLPRLGAVASTPRGGRVAAAGRSRRRRGAVASPPRGGCRDEGVAARPNCWFRRRSDEAATACDDVYQKYFYRNWEDDYSGNEEAAAALEPAVFETWCTRFGYEYVRRRRR